jgi:hypothetical protein
MYLSVPRYRHAQTYHCGNKWRLDLTQQQFIPLNSAKKCLLLDIFSITFTWAQTALRILTQQLKWRDGNSNHKNMKQDHVWVTGGKRAAWFTEMLVTDQTKFTKVEQNTVCSNGLEMYSLTKRNGGPSLPHYKGTLKEVSLPVILPPPPLKRNIIINSVWVHKIYHTL